MKRKICFTLMATLLFSATACGGTKKKDLGPVDVVIISGQSNAVGCTYIDGLHDTMEDKYQEFEEGYPEIKMAYDNWTKDWPSPGVITFYSQQTSGNNGFVPVKLGQGNQELTFGPEIGIAEALHEKYANKLFLIKFACGGSNLKDDWMNRDSEMFPRMMEYIAKQMASLKKQGYTPTIKAFCWMQGEGDSYQGYYQLYKQSLETFVGNLREDLAKYTNGKTLPFIDAAISLADVWPNPEAVNWMKYQFSLESEYNIYIDTNAAGMHTDQEPMFEPDPCHYDSDSEVLLGHLFADAFEQFLEPIEK